jgi:osmotically-inducible protein OsmY
MKGMKRHMWATVMTMAAVSAAPALAQERASLTDRQIQAQVEHRLEKKDINRVAVGVADGTVSLSGTVANAWAKQEAVEQALKVKSVVGVANNIAVLRAESDEMVARELARKVRTYVRYTIFDDVQIGVENGVATLSGRVTMPYKADELADIASRVRGVQEVRNEVQALPVSINDDRLRGSLARRIYRDSLFSTYAFHAYPPIHIVVERGNVTLSGAVGSEVERVKAGMIARSTFGVFNVENRLIVAR